MIATMNEHAIEVSKVEHHYWPTCPCDACEAERERRVPPTNSHIKKLSPEQARVLGYRKAKRHSVDEDGTISGEVADVHEMGYLPRGASVAGQVVQGVHEPSDC